MLNCFLSLSPHLTANVLFISKHCFFFFAKGAYLTEDTQPGRDSLTPRVLHKVPNTDNQSMRWTEPTVLNTVNNYPPLMVWTLHYATGH